MAEGYFHPDLTSDIAPVFNQTKLAFAQNVQVPNCQSRLR